MSPHSITTTNQRLPRLYVEQDESALCLIGYVNDQHWLFHPFEGFVIRQVKGLSFSTAQTKRPMTVDEAAKFLDKIETQLAQEPKNARLAELYSYAISWYYAEVVR